MKSKPKETKKENPKKEKPKKEKPKETKRNFYFARKLVLRQKTCPSPENEFLSHKQLDII